ncbi:recombination protein RecR [Candidatus Kaiserbacteria bacterium]|nr:recombination protein RecR [Candidatus Kaiserbacteria bacterium]
MDSIERLSALFERFPGIGPRQAGRFVQYLLRSSPTLRGELVDSVQGLASSVHQCPECFRYHSAENKVCSICANPARDQSILAVVATDADLAAIERSGTFRGRYFVLGGTISLANEKTTGLRLKELKKMIAERRDLAEIVLAFPANPEGDATSNKIRDEMTDFVNPSLKITNLGRGLSTGSELEYADPETLKSALANRK